MSIVNKPKVSRAIAGTYEVFAVFIVALTVFFVCLTVFTPIQTIAGIVASIVTAFVGSIMVLILAAIYRTRYTLTNDELVIDTTRFIGGSKTIPLKAIRSVEQTMIPFGVRLFGASFYGGYYYVPSLGRAFLAITNYEDGVLIKTEQRNYVITPSNPSDFKKIIESRINDCI